MFLLDAHLDLSMNAIEWNRDLTLPLARLRAEETHLLPKKPGQGRGTVSLPEMRRANIGLCVATQIARVEHNAWSPVAGWRSPAQAYAMTQAQLAWYQAMEEIGEMVQIHNLASLEKHVALWLDPHAAELPQDQRPVGYILSLEGADSILSMRHLEKSVAAGLRAIGPAHYGPGIYANGTDSTGGLNARGRELLKECGRLGLILDMTHLCDDAFFEAIDLYEGPLWASHHNCRALVDHNRQLSDEMIGLLVQRGGVIGVALDAWMLVPGWQRGITTPQSSGVSLHHVADHIEHICQVAGNALHVGLGSDLDGAFGTEQTPGDLDSIADLVRLPCEILPARGFDPAALEGFAHGNFLRFLRAAWA